MKVESLRVRNFRGIKDLRLEAGGRNFVVDGPNGAGKSGIVDALEFVFTGRIARLEGAGTGGLSVKTHGPHVDKRDNPREAYVEVTVRLENGDGVVTVTRGLDDPKTAKVSPDSAAESIRWLSEHPEIALSRRELIKFILAEPGERAKAIQALLKLESLDEARRNFTTAANSLGRDLKGAEKDVSNARDRLLAAVGIPALKVEEILSEANKRRKLLDLTPLTELQPTTKLAGGIGESSDTGVVTITKEIATKDLDELEKYLAKEQPNNQNVSALLADVLHVVGNADLVTSLEHHDLIVKGLDLAVAAACPLCDADWDPVKLRAHLSAKLERAREAKHLAAKLKDGSATVANDIRTLSGHVELVAKHAASVGAAPEATRLRSWASDLSKLRASLSSLQGTIAARDSLSTDWTTSPAHLAETLRSVRAALGALRGTSEADEAKKYLLVCDERLEVYRSSKTAEKRLKVQAEGARRAKDLFDKTLEAELAQLYRALEGDLVRYYRFINADDEGSFQAKLESTGGKLTLEVDFYARGLFPPGAYHSEGHQDGMGLCLYLALMKHVLGPRFTFCVLDDVLMSVDKAHRKQVCGLLKAEFPKTQFIITTHDDVWLHQMIAVKLVDKKAVRRFRGWSVDEGPLVDDYKEVWESIEDHLEKEEISQAAALLRRNLEQVAGELCERFRASAPYRRDADHDLGDLLPAATGRWGKLLKEAKAVAGSWGKKEEVGAIEAREARFKARLDATSMEQWAVNKSVHYNEWATMTRNDFAPVVAAYRELLACFRCDSCGGELAVSPPKGTPDAILCDCKSVCLNLKKKTGGG